MWLILCGRHRSSPTTPRKLVIGVVYLDVVWFRLILRLLSYISRSRIAPSVGILGMGIKTSIICPRGYSETHRLEAEGNDNNPRSGDRCERKYYNAGKVVDTGLH